MIGSAPSSVMRWRDALQSGGEEALKVRFSSGRPPALTAAQRKQVVKLLLKGAIANDFSTELWTTGRVAILIQKHCRVQFHRSHAARLLHELARGLLLDSNALRKIPRLVDVGAAKDRHVVGEQL